MVKWTKKKVATAKADGAARSPRHTDGRACRSATAGSNGRAGAPSPAEKAKKAKKEAK